MDKISDNLYKTFVYDDRYKYILEGLGNTLIIAFFAVIIGVILGILYLLLEIIMKLMVRVRLVILLQIVM